MTARLATVLAVIQPQLKIADETFDPFELDTLYRALLDHVRARRPESVGFLGQLPPPDRIVDPRSKG